MGRGSPSGVGRWLVSAACAGLIAWSGGCGPERGSGSQAATAFQAGAGKPRILVVNYPLAYFAERLGGDLVEVAFPAPADVDPAFWTPDEPALAQYQDADLILLSGAGYAKWIKRVALPQTRIVNTSKSYADALIQVSDGVVHAHGPGGEHSHIGFASTTWLDPQLALAQATEVHRALLRLLPDQRSSLETNKRALQADLEELDRQLEAVCSRYRGQPLLASHPVYQYLARRGGWKLRSLDWEPGEIPTDRQWAELVELRAAHPAAWMLWEAEPIAETAERLADQGVASVVYLTCGNRPEGDFLEIMQANLQRLEVVFPE